MKGKIEYYNPEKGFGIISTTNVEGYVTKFFMPARNIIKRECLPAVWCDVEFEISAEEPRRENDYHIAVNVQVLDASKRAILETLAKDGAK